MSTHAGGSVGGHSAATTRSSLVPSVLPVKPTPRQQQQRESRPDTDEVPGRPDVAASKGGTSVSSGTGIFVDGAKDSEGSALYCLPFGTLDVSDR